MRNDIIGYCKFAGGPARTCGCESDAAAGLLVDPRHFPAAVVELPVLYVAVACQDSVGQLGRGSTGSIGRVEELPHVLFIEGNVRDEQMRQLAHAQAVSR